MNACIVPAAHAQERAEFTPPIRLVVPFPAGGPTDIVARPLAQALSNALGQQVVVDNRGGAGGNIGAAAAAQARPDGYTRFLGSVGTNAINQSLYKRLPFDPAKDFTPISLLASAPVAVVVHRSAPATTLALGRDAAERTTLYGLLEDGLDRRIARTETTVRALVPDAAAAAHLGTAPQGFVLAMARKSYDDFGQLCESALFRVRADRHEFVLGTEGRTAGNHMRIRAARVGGEGEDTTQRETTIHAAR